LLCIAQPSAGAGDADRKIPDVRQSSDDGPGCPDHVEGQAGLFIEDDPAGGIVTLFNRNRSATKFYYDWESSFGDYQMFFIRFRDASGKVVPLNGSSGCGWWTPKALGSTLYSPGEWPPRKTIVIPPGGSVQIKRDFSDFLMWLGRVAPSVAGPCQVQFRLYGYARRRTWQSISADSQWQQGPCPRSGIGSPNASRG
jgi:hypothetical protein